LYTALTSGPAATQPEIYGSNTNAFVLNRNDVIDIVLNNLDTGKHPFHLHGHNFQVLSRSDPGSGTYDPNNATQNKFPATPIRRDTLLVKPLSNFIIRFRADNPGIWLFHCHIEWHTAAGLVATFIEAPLDIQSNMSIPQDHFQICEAQKIPIAGNAAGNTVDLFDLTGENKSPPPLPAGFTAKGYVAMVFSCVSAFLGLAFISWYGMLPIIKPEAKGVSEGNGHVSYSDSSESTDGVVEQIVEEPKIT
jgi:iron transport multicopper oxidase